MTICDELGILIPAIVEDRLLHAPKTRSGIGANVFKTKRFDDVDHVIGTATIVACQNINLGWRIPFSCRNSSLLRSHLGNGRLHERGSACQHAALQKFPPLDVSFLRHSILQKRCLALMIYDCRAWE